MNGSRQWFVGPCPIRKETTTNRSRWLQQLAMTWHGYPLPPSPSGRGIEGEGEPLLCSGRLTFRDIAAALASFSLTPALSRWERENSRPSSADSGSPILAVLQPRRMIGLYVVLVALLIPASLAFAAAPEFGRHTFFVATNGNDAWSGTLAVPNRERTDGPFANVPHALQTIREHRRQSRGLTVIKLYQRRGTYYLEEPLVLKPEDSLLQWMAYPGEKPVISGGCSITGWREVIVNGRKLWAAEVPGSRDGKRYFRELWVNGERRVRARHPNSGYFKIKGLPDKAAQWTDGHRRFEFNAGDLVNWPGITNGEVVAMARWVESRLPVTGIDETRYIVNFGKRSVFELQPDDRYYLEGVFEALDAPGEWYLDAAAGVIYYSPKRGERLKTFTAIAPVLSQVLRLAGDVENNKPVRDIEFDGLTFSHTEWRLPRPGDTNAPSGFSQAAVGVPGAIWGEDVQHCVFTNCTIAHVGTYAIELARGCSRNRIACCDIYDLGAGGIKLGETAIRKTENEMTRGNEVSDCRIHHGGKMFQSGIGVWLGQSPNNVLSHNEINDFYYTGISIGWTWGYGPALASNNIVEFNHVHHIGVASDGDGPVLSDMAGIYMLGKQPGTRVVNNLWHDMAATKYGGWGIYTDEGSSGILIESNLVYRTTHGGFHQHYGETNIVRNNIFAFARDQQLQRSREEDHLSFSFTNNIVYFDHGVLLGSTWKNNKFILDRNVYWDTRLSTNPAAMKFAGATLGQWRARGHDQNSLIADPLFVAPRKDDFRLKSKSPALQLGFQPIDLRGIGPRR